MNDSPTPQPDLDATALENVPDPHDSAAGGEVMVVGGAGFIGSHLVERLLAAAVSVDVVDDLSTGSLGNLASARETARINGGVLRIHTVSANADEFRSLVALRRPVHIFHLGVLAPGFDDAAAMTRSFAAALNVLEAARASGVAKVVVLLPAMAMHGEPSSRDLPVKEGDIVARGVRGVVAKAIVDLLSHYREEHGIEFTALAGSSVYGPRQRADRGVVAAMVEAVSHGAAPTVVGDGRQTRDFLYVDDAVDALIRTRERGTGLVVNVGTGTQTQIRELATVVARGGPEPTFVAARPGEIGRFSVSPVRARIHLGWAPWTTLADGISLTRNPPSD